MDIEGMFKHAFEKGIASIKPFEEAAASINEVFNELQKQILEASGEKIKLTISKKEDGRMAITATSGSVEKEIAEWGTGLLGGFPCTLKYGTELNPMDQRITDLNCLQGGLHVLISDINTAIIFRDLMES